MFGPGRLALVAHAAVAVFACGKTDRSATATGTATSTATSAPTAAPPAASNSARALAKAAPPSADRLVHNTVTKDECTFDFDAPELLRKTESDAFSITYQGERTAFQGFTGASLDDFGLTASMVKPVDTLYFDEKGDPQLVVSRVSTPSKPSYAVRGSGNEKRPKERTSGLGCAFICSGVKDAEGDVLSMCRSVRIKHDEKNLSGARP